MSLPQTPYSANERLAFTSPMYAKQSYDPYAVDTPGRAETTSFLSPSTSRVNHLPYAARDAGTPLISVIEGRTKRLSWALVLPAVVVFLVTAGAATTMLAWMHLHKEQSSLREVWEQKAFVLSEGVKEKDGFKVAKLLGLTISSAAVSSMFSLWLWYLIGLTVECCGHHNTHFNESLCFPYCSCLVDHVNWNGRRGAPQASNPITVRVAAW